MLVAAFDAGVVPAINQAIDAGIPVGTFEADYPKRNKRMFFVGVNAGSGGAAATAVKELGLVGKVKIICQDRDDITSTIVTRTALNTYMGLLLLYQYNHFDVPITANNKANNVVWLPSDVDVGTFVVNKTNGNAFFQKK